MVHSKLFSPSSASRRIACPGSARMEASRPDKTSIYAMEGTAAHLLCETCLKSGRDAESYLGYTIGVNERHRGENLLFHPNSHIPTGYKRFSVKINMVEAVQVYLDYCRSQSHGDCYVETQIHVNEDVYGTPDFLCAVPFGPLYVNDYKHGTGVIVSPKGNAQAMIYALAGLKTSPYDHSIVLISIIQPRTLEDTPIKSSPVSVQEIYQWADDVLYPAVEACKAPNAPLVAGAHCRFCKAAGDCAEQVRKAKAVSKATEKDGNIVLPLPDSLTIEEQAEAFKDLEHIALWRGQLEEAMLEKAYTEGVKYPGLKMVPKSVKRKWKDPSSVQKRFEPIIGGACFKASSLDSPASFIRTLIEKGWDKKSAEEEVNKYVLRREGDPKFVTEETRGKKILPVPAAFSALPKN